MRGCFQGNTNINMVEHGEQVWDKTRKLILGQFEEFKLPDWFIKNHHFIVNSLHDWETIEMYNLYHDCGKPRCKTVDEEGKIHYPNHAKVSAEVFTEYFPQFPEVANLIFQDMVMHTFRYEAIEKLHLPSKDTWTLLLTAFAEIHANAELFGGIESTSFKIKLKNLDKLGKKLIEKIQKHNDSYLYIFVRRDIKSEHKLVQAGHAVFEQAKTMTEHPSFVVLGVHDEDDLKNTMSYLLDNDINFKIFREPMFPYNGELTAICTEPLAGDRRLLLKDFQLLKI